SHILSEVQQTADRVAILARGRLIKAGPVHEVLAAGRARGMLVRVSDPEAGRRALAAANLSATIDAGVLRVDAQPDQGERISRALAAGDLFPSELRPDEVTWRPSFWSSPRMRALAHEGVVAFGVAARSLSSVGSDGA